MPRHTFHSALGRCAFSWDGGALIGCWLPEAPVRADDVAAPPAWIATLVGRVQAHLAGEMQDFADAPLDWERVNAFHRRVLVATQRVPAGHTRTYGEIAAAIGEPPAASRAVGAALGANPWPLLVPCHRIVGVGGRMTGFSAAGGIALKTKLLRLEGALLFDV